MADSKAGLTSSEAATLYVPDSIKLATMLCPLKSVAPESEEEPESLPVESVSDEDVPDEHAANEMAKTAIRLTKRLNCFFLKPIQTPSILGVITREEEIHFSCNF